MIVLRNIALALACIVLFVAMVGLFAYLAKEHTQVYIIMCLLMFLFGVFLTINDATQLPPDDQI